MVAAGIYHWFQSLEQSQLRSDLDHQAQDILQSRQKIEAQDEQLELHNKAINQVEDSNQRQDKSLKKIKSELNQVKQELRQQKLSTEAAQQEQSATSKRLAKRIAGLEEDLMRAQNGQSELQGQMEEIQNQERDTKSRLERLEALLGIDPSNINPKP